MPAGSVAIGGAQGGIYPRELPGGWHLIGRTPLPLFDLRRTPPNLLAVGAALRFRRIDRAEWQAEMKLHDELFAQLAFHLPAELPATKARIEARLAELA